MLFTTALRGMIVANSRSFAGRKFFSARGCHIHFRHGTSKALSDCHYCRASVKQLNSAFLRLANTNLGNKLTNIIVLIVQVTTCMMLMSGQAFGHDAPPDSVTQFRSINSVEGVHDADQLNFTISFINSQPIENGFEFQLFFDSDFNHSTGYGLGYDALIRGVQLVPQRPLDLVMASGGSSSGEWGQVISSASFDQINSFDFQISIPRIQPLPQTGSVRFGIEIYQWGALVDSARGLSTSQAPFEDCNGNGLADSQEIADGLTPDCNNNNSPDSCDLNSGNASDCNSNGVLDICDIYALVSDDCTGNLIPDECEPDCNSNNLADSCDIAMGLSGDCDLNKIPDECQPLAKGLSARYLEIHPPAGFEPVAIRIRGSQDDPVVSCLDGFVQMDGSIDTTPTFQLPDSWCTVFVFDFSIVADREYLVDLVSATSVLESTTAKTWLWGDLTNDLEITISDVVYVIASSQGTIAEGFPASDLVPCIPDGQLGISDIIASINALVAGINPDGLLCGSPCG